ncbi:MAG: hypothetical protein K9N48_03810 [Verrucomicrobia bacterium]|nr:hypothetical protein [Verrucomicrobiota bacterium]MCF7708068.1 hypothetical protein [Verrucomicrobiota bacterium]
MVLQLNDIVRYRSDKLFNGAVNIDWFLTDEDKCRAAAKAFVFHGPTYHGVDQNDVGSAHGHQLQDTVTFSQAVVRRCCGQEEQPFTLAIAGYGTGKSHLGLSLSLLLSNPGTDDAHCVLSKIQSADSTIGKDIGAILQEAGKPCLVVALNGMRSFDLAAELTRQVLHQLRMQEVDTTALEELRPRFKQAARLIEMSGNHIVQELLGECNVENTDDLLGALEAQDEKVYKAVHDFFAKRGMPIRALGGESVRDVIDLVCREYCGSGKHYTKLAIFFDEFGRYTEFATMRSQIAGSGALQDLFEGIQGNSDLACLVGFIQFELNAYVQRVAPEYKNEILRYITRYQSADRVYLSINMETLLASLLEKTDPELVENWLGTEVAKEESENIAGLINTWYPQAANHSLWRDSHRFHTVIRKGCWPLSPFSTWFLYYLAAAGKHLQERSVLTLLEDVFRRHAEDAVSEDEGGSLHPADLWTPQLQEELISSEESGQHGSITHAYVSVVTRHEAQLSVMQQKILRSTVLASKLGLKVSSQDQAIEALAHLTGEPFNTIEEGVTELKEEQNVLEWDERFKQFDIMGDAVPRTQFLSFLRQRVASSFDEKGKAQLFASKADAWCDVLSELECDFAEENSITTREWRYELVTTCLELLPTQIAFAADRCSKAIAVDEPRGTVIYCYVEPSIDSQSVADDVKRLLREASGKVAAKKLPLLVVLIGDEDGRIGQALAELEVLETSITEQDKLRFGNLLGAHTEKTMQVLSGLIEERIKQRLYVTGLKSGIESRRLKRVGTELFERVFDKPMPFPFDGFTTARGNAADTCQALTSELLTASLDYSSLIAKPPKVKNRGLLVLRETWGVFGKDGRVSRRPAEPVVRSIIQRWDKILKGDTEHFVVGDVLSEACRPPHGANIASAGLLLGVFVAPRHKDLAIIQDGQQFSIDQWLQNGVFSGKFLDFNALGGSELVLIGESSSEWEELLDEWESAETYIDRINGLNRALKLKERVSIPPTLSYRFEHLQDQANQASDALQEIEKKQKDAFGRIESGYKHEDVKKITWGASDLSKIVDTMRSQQPYWSQYQIKELEPYIERFRQMAIQMFPRWLNRQMPSGDAPDVIGDFKHIMLNVLGKNLKKLGMEKEYEELEKRTMELVRNADTAAEARQLLRDVDSWLDQHADRIPIERVSKLREFRDIGKKYSSKLQGISRRINLQELSEARTRLSEFLSKLKMKETEITKRAERLWQTDIGSGNKLKDLVDEVDELIPAFAGSDQDIEDFRIIRRLLQEFDGYYRCLQDNNMTWKEWHERAEEIQKKVEVNFGEEELPWEIPEVFGILKKEITAQRIHESEKWTYSLKEKVADIDNMSVFEANQLHIKTNSPPALLTGQDAEVVAKVKERIEQRLDALTLDWLLEKFKELPESSKREFIRLATELLITP